MTAYQRGNYFERRVADQLRNDGYFVWQTRGSKTVVDMIALKTGQVGQTLLVQAKGGLVIAGTEHITGNDWNTLYTLACQVGAVPLIAQRTGRGSIGYRQITDRHTPRSHTWPAQSWTPDDAELAAAIARRRGDG